MTYRTYSSAETKKLGERIGRSLAPVPRRARVFSLTGDLGAGKTTFLQGFAKGLGARGRVTSPTFVLMRRLPVRHPGFKNYYHLDAYRLASEKDLTPLGFAELARNPENVIVVEWADRVAQALPRGAYRIRFRYGAGPDERIIQTP